MHMCCSFREAVFASATASNARRRHANGGTEFPSAQGEGPGPQDQKEDCDMLEGRPGRLTPSEQEWLPDVAREMASTTPATWDAHASDDHLFSPPPYVTTQPPPPRQPLAHPTPP